MEQLSGCPAAEQRPGDADHAGDDKALWQFAGDKALYGLVLEHKEGKTEISDEEKARVPPSALAELITSRR